LALASRYHGRNRIRSRIRDRDRVRNRDQIRVRIHHFRIAYGSALEAGSLLELLARLGAVDQQRATATLELLDRVRALTWRLIHPRR